MSRARDIANYGDGIDTSSITSGTFADARIAQSNVTQHEGSIDALASNPTVTLGSNTTFPTSVTDRSIWYVTAGYSENFNYQDRYLTSNNMDNAYCRTSGCAPNNFTSITEIKGYFVSSTSDPGTYSGINFAWMIGSNGHSYQQHTRALSISTSGNFSASAIREIDFFNASGDGNDFEDNIAANDVFGIRFGFPDVSAFVAMIGLKITWRF